MFSKLGSLTASVRQDERRPIGAAGGLVRSQRDPASRLSSAKVSCCHSVVSGFLCVFGCSLATALLPFGVPSAQANVIANGGFESGSGTSATDWFEGESSATQTLRTNAAAASGSYSEEYTTTNSAPGDGFRSYGVDLTTGTGTAIPGNEVVITWSWEFSNVVDPSNTQGFGINVRFFSAPPINNSAQGTFLGQSFFATGVGTSSGFGLGSSANFLSESQTYLAPVGSESMDVVFNPVASGESGTVYIDNISVAPVPEPGALSLTVWPLALVSLLLVRKRRLV